LPVKNSSEKALLLDSLMTAFVSQEMLFEQRETPGIEPVIQVVLNQPFLTGQHFSENVIVKEKALFEFIQGSTR